ncbi:hypothetical protein BCR22_05220 [Enterococcus plantarum]|nr:hypothetical protein BCR22_05220 [Enterococcus plantarum]
MLMIRSGNLYQFNILGGFFITSLEALWNHPHSRWFSEHTIKSSQTNVVQLDKIKRHSAGRLVVIPQSLIQSATTLIVQVALNQFSLTVFILLNIS